MHVHLEFIVISLICSLKDVVLLKHLWIYRQIINKFAEIASIF